MDVNGYENSATRTITVVDTEAPTLTCPATVTAVPGVVTFAMPTATDNSGDTPNVVCRDASNAVVTSPLTLTTGSYTLTCLATDDSNNVSPSCSFAIDVIDNVKPTITCPGAIFQSLTSVSLSTSNVTAVDNVAVSSVSCTRSDGNTLAQAYPEGLTVVTCTATDSSNNEASCNVNVTIDMILPVLASCPSDFNLPIPAGQVGWARCATYISRDCCGYDDD